MDLPARRHLAWDACYNARDLGDYATVDGHQIRWGALVRSDNLGHLTPAGQAALIEYGIGSILDLRSTEEQVRFPHFFQATRLSAPLYLGLALVDETDEVAKAAREVAGSQQAWYCLVLDQSRSRVATIMRAFAEAAPGGVVIHCHAGKDRTGLVVALLLSLAGVPHSLIAEDYAASDTYLQPLYAQWLAEVAHDGVQHAKLARELTAPPETMLAVLDYLVLHYGGVSRYLQGTDVTAKELDAIRDRLLV